MLPSCYHNELLEAGCDEAGRGCLAGPVFAAAVILPKGFGHDKLDDSKKMTPANRSKLREIICGEALAWAVAEIPPGTIDAINILRSSFEAMNEAVGKLTVSPQFLLIDGNRFVNRTGIPYKCIVGGDGKYANIAAASVLAKTYRDEYMERLAEEYPQYGWDSNKGYATRRHRIAIRKFGLTEHHRRTFCSAYTEPELFTEERL